MFSFRISFVLLAAIAGICSLLGYIVPLSALAAAATLFLPRRAAWALAIVAFGLNQAVGFGLRGYPYTHSTFLWGGVLGVATLVAVAVVPPRKQQDLTLLHSGMAFVFSFAGFQTTLLLATVWLGGWEANTAAILAKVLIANAAWFVVCVGVCWFAGGVAKVRRARA